MQRQSCPHCGFRNAPEQHFCGRCEQALHEAPEGAEEELKTQVDFRLADLQHEEPDHRQPLRPTAPTDIHTNLLPQTQPTPNRSLPLAERPTAPWSEESEGRTAQTALTPPRPTQVASKPSRTAVEPWARATVQLHAGDLPASERLQSPRRPAAPPDNPPLDPTDFSPASTQILEPSYPPPKVVLRPRNTTLPASPPEMPVETRRLDARERLRGLPREEGQTRPAPTSEPLPQSVATQIHWPHSARQLAAVGIDLLVWLGASSALLALVVATVPRAAWPETRPTFLEALAMWLAHSGRWPWVLLVGSAGFAALYALWGAASGRTVGRMCCGLKLVDGRGQIPGVGAGLWHILGGAMGVLALGAGLLWPIVDPAARTWASLTSRTFVIRA